MNKEKKGLLRSLFNGSLIFSSLDRLAAFLYRKAEDGTVGGIMTAYEKENRALSTGLLSRIGARFDFTKKIKHAFAKGCERSRILLFFDRFVRSFAAFTVRQYGIAFCMFAIVSMLMYLTVSATDELSALIWINPLTSIIFLIIGIVMLFSGKRLCDAIDESALLSRLIYSVIGVRAGSLDCDKVPGGKPWGALLIGTALGLLAAVLPTVLIPAAIIGLFLIYTILIIPEFGVVASLFALCFLPTMVMVAMISYTFLCYLLKLWRGKRIFRLHLMDATVIIFFIFMLGGGISSVAGGGSLLPAMVYLCFMLGYFLMVNLIRTKAWVMRCVYAIVSSSAIVVAYGIYQNFFEEQDTRWQDTSMFEDISGRVVSTFENPNVLGEYLIMVLPMLLALLIISRGVSGKLSCCLLLGVSGACMIFTWSRGAWLGLMFAFFLFFLFYTRKTMILCICGVFALPFLPSVLPDNIINRITSIGNMADSSTSYRVSIWEGAVSMLSDYWLSGIGIGEKAFARIYPFYALSGIEAAPHAHNLFLQTAIEVGIPGLIALLAVLFVLIQSALSFYRYCRNGIMQSEKLLSLAVVTGILGVALQGLTDYIWYNYRVYLMFWLMLGLAVAIRRVALESAELAILHENTYNEVNS